MRQTCKNKNDTYILKNNTFIKISMNKMIFRHDNLYKNNRFKN